ncbi:carboxypeptidase regulatory-like domain-containing protein [Bythopirellula polymerisocia]|uniref:Carboxypeptidase regulatory-like domain-containing protein n=1 Tax=Bythopirellula polymerisocia TaxID=2528003 RepID=A0A5C6CV99_9BACT|nr:carboxypeptidase regulatory-like domain-containing protein [Bythopirellula polymerisocia]TWU27584.1 hypothetical protein Pla144_23610 [Bythopirellula polymerisocia]
MMYDTLKASPIAISNSVSLTILICFSLATISGCGGASHELETAPVTGTVKMDGQPVTSGYVFILPGKGRMAKGSIQEDGTFVMSTYDEGDGVQVGEHPVIVTPIPAGEGTPRPKGRATEIPPKYMKASSSGLTINVQPGDSNQLNLELSSKS